MSFDSENIIAQIKNLYFPEKVFLFGSQAKGTATKSSDIDLCVVMNTDNKRKLLADMYFNIDSDLPIDFLLYTPNEWANCVEDSASFAYKIVKEGVLLYGRQ